MRRAICWLLWMSLLGCAWGQQASSNSGTVPTVIRFSGNLADANGKPLSGMVGVTFSLYKDEQGGAPLWVETQNAQADKSGHYAVTLGSTSSQGLPTDLFASGEARWLGVQPQGLTEQSRVLLMSVPYALKAADAETLGGKPASAFLAASGVATNSGSSGDSAPALSGKGKPGYVALWKTSSSLTFANLFQSTGGNIGIGTAKPAANFDVNGTEDIRNTLTLFPKGSAPTLTVNGTAFNVSNTGLLSFVSGQTFPGTGTITGVNTANGSGLTGGGTSGNLNLSLLSTCTASQVLQWNGSAWVCSNAGTGTITGVAHGTYLTGGGTSGNVTLDLDTTKVPLLGTANTFAGTQTVGSGDLAINTGNLDLPQTGGTTSGVITLGGAPFISACCSSTSFNTFVGTGAGNFNTQSGYNTAVGYQALTNNTASTNTAIGTTALTANTTGNSNTAVGTSSLQVNTQGGSNTAVGAGALESNGLGLSNTALGSGAGHSNTSGSNNTFVGQAADAGSQTLTNATAIGSAAIVNESNALVLGAPGVNVGIGTATPAYALDVHGTGNFTGAVTFSSGQTFPNTISGVTTAAGSGLTGGGTSGNLNLSITNACASGQVLTWSGSAWVCTNLSGGGTITGVIAGTDLLGGGYSGNVTLNLDTTNVPQLKTANTFTGDQTVNGNLSATGVVTGSGFQIGSNLFAFGSYAKDNTFLGFAGNSETTGFDNTASGFEALYSNTTGGGNTAAGSTALYNNTTSSYNTASGFAALGFNITGSANTAVGSSALVSNTTGAGNTALGYQADVGNPDLTNATAIGANAVVSESNALVLGGTGSNAVKVGIGTTAPSHVFTIGQGAGHAIADGWDAYSSRRWKTNIHPLQGALAKVEQLRGVSYDLKASGKHEVGVIAEEVGAVVPEIVSWEKNGKDAQGVDYSRLTALLIEATKEQQTLIRKEQQQIKAQQMQMKAQQTQIRTQQRQILAERTRNEARFARLASQVNGIQASLKTNSGTDTEVRTAVVHVPTVVR